jgi:hypothetical protein
MTAAHKFPMPTVSSHLTTSGPQPDVIARYRTLEPQAQRGADRATPYGTCSVRDVLGGKTELPVKSNAGDRSAIDGRADLRSRPSPHQPDIRIRWYGGEKNT